MRRMLTSLLPLLILTASILGAWAMVAPRPVVETHPPEVLPPLIRVLTVQPQDLQLTVRTQGTVTPRTEIDLVPEVSGRVVSIAPSLAAGGFFEAGEILLTIDPRDYELAVSRAQAEVAQAEQRRATAEAEAAVARQEWESLGHGEASPLALREPQLAEARAALVAARAALEQAQRDLKRTRVPAPFAGRVREKSVDVGQFVTRGTPVGKIYAVDYAEVRLPLSDDQLAFLDLPLDYRGEEKRKPGPQVRLRAKFAGRQHVWSGRIVRTEGAIDPKSRVVYAVARVENPYSRGERPERPPLAVGLFVEAEILGRHVQDAVVLPRAAVRSGDQVLVVDSENRLRFRPIETLQADGEKVVAHSGLAADERICVSPLDTAVDGMKVRTVEESSAIELTQTPEMAR
jgi:membrane fusion protein, multidrug efflux system